LLVADEAQETPHPFDLATVKSLIRLMSRHDLSELDLTDGDQRIRLRRGARITTVAAPISVQQPVVSGAVPTPVAPTVAPTPAPATNLIEIKSQGVGTYFAQEKEGAAPYVTIGLRVTPMTTVGLVEAMKVFSEIPAGVSGVVREILVKNGEAVEYNQVLFRVDPAA